MSRDWVIDKLIELDPYIDKQMLYDTGTVIGIKRFSQLVKEVGQEKALKHPEAERLMDWIYENSLDPN